MSLPKLETSEEVRAGQAAGLPVVALESTLISHGLPWPSNFETACEAESAVRAAGTIPATIAVLEGVIRVGLGRAEMERLAHSDEIAKASPRDLPWLLAQRRSGATTVAGTMFVAHLADIRIMATGGIGGVHRGASESGDISADLIELAQTPVAVVCSGAKAILDLPRTLEFLETQGVPVIGFRTSEFPAFYSPSSGLPLEHRANSAAEAAAVIHHARLLNLQAGILIAQPPPAIHALPCEEVERAVAMAVDAAGRAGITGKQVTPFLLNRVRELIGERALAVNRALVVQNARLAAEIACALNAKPD